MVAEKVKKTLAEDEPNANHSLRKIAKRESISRSTAQRILRKDLGVKSVRKIKGQRLSQKRKVSRLARCIKIKELINRKKGAGKINSNNLFFSDEKIFRILETSGGTQNNRLWIPGDMLKCEMPARVLILECETNAPGVMVGLSVGQKGITRPVFIDKGCKMNSDVYVNQVLKGGYFPEISAIAGKDWSFQQDGAPSRRSKQTFSYLRNNTPAFIGEWPPKSPDLNPLDYSIWSILAQDVNSQNPEDYNDLRACITRAVKKLDQETASKACGEFAMRIDLCISERGGHFEHLLKAEKRKKAKK